MSVASTAPRAVHILVVDDDPGVLELVRDFLVQYDYHVITATDAATMAEALRREHIDLIVLDLRLPDEDGLSLARKVRARSEMPIIMLTALGSEVDRIVGLELGADDYLPKPFNPRELLARIRAVLRRTKGIKTDEEGVEPDHEAFCFEGWVLDTTARRLIAPEGKAVELTGGEFNLLEAFVRAPHCVLTRDRLLASRGTPDAEVFDRSIDVLILRLRRKIEPNPRQPRMIRTERGVGYVFTPAVTRV